MNHENRRYQIIFHFNPPQKPTAPFFVENATSMADALAQAETILLRSQEISLVCPSFPKSVTVSRVGNWRTEERKGTSGEQSQ